MYFGNILMMIWKAVFTKYAAQGIRDVSDIRLYPVPAGYLATFYSGSGSLESRKQIMKPDNFT